MSKILISGLGTGRKVDGGYQTANYILEGKKYRDRSFVSSVLEEHYQIDKTIYIGTVGSMWDNLYQHYCSKYNVPLDDQYSFYLMEKVEQANQNTDLSSLDLQKFQEDFSEKVDCRVTHYGINTEEIFSNFNIIMNLQDVLGPGDEVYLDITHSFRSNAMWMFLVMNFITDILGDSVQVKTISYGMLETREKIKNVSGEEELFAPIVDLHAFYQLLKWIKGAESFKNYGNSYTFLEYIPNDNISKKMKHFSDALNLNYIASLKQNIQSLKKIMPDIEQLEGPASLLIPQAVKEFLKEFDGVEEDYLLQLKLAKWHASQKRYAIAYVNVNEAVKSFIGVALEEKDDDRIKEWLFRLGGYVKHRVHKQDKDVIRLKNLYTIFEGSRTVRNEAAHSLGEKVSAIQDIENLRKYCQDLEGILIPENLKFIGRKELEWEFLERNKK